MKLKKATMAITIASALMLGTSLQAKSFAEMYTDCGIGGAIASDVPAVAVISNITWDLGTTAVSSGVSSENSCAKRSVRSAGFVYGFYPELEKDIAKGNGKYLDSLVKISKPDYMSKEKYVSYVRTEFSTIASSDTERWKKAEALYNIASKFEGKKLDI